MMGVVMAVSRVIAAFHSIPIDEVGERYAFIGTSVKYPRAAGDGVRRREKEKKSRSRNM